MAKQVYSANPISIMWLDHESSHDRTIAREELCKVIGHLELYTDPVKCVAALQRNIGQVVLIVSGQIGQQLVPRVHHFAQLATVFVYCMDKQRNKEWSQRYVKVRKVLTDLNKLISYVQQEVRHLSSLTLNTRQPIPTQRSSTSQHSDNAYSTGRPHRNDYSFPKSRTEMATNVNYLDSKSLANRWQQDDDLGFDQLKVQRHELSTLNFRSTQNHKAIMELRVFIEFIIRLPQSNNLVERKLLCDSLKAQHNTDSSVLSKINEFEKEYHPSKAIFWYTSETCLYRELNSALRQFDYSRLIDFAFFIRDIHHQLASEQKERPPSSNGYRYVFRGQLMSKMELHLLESMSIGTPDPLANIIPFLPTHAQRVPQQEALVMKTFLSTSKRQDLAEMYLSDTQRRSDAMQAVLFRIDIGDDPVSPCASVAHLSPFGLGEDEVIFMTGIVFWLQSVTRNEHIWIVDVKARQVYEQLNNSIRSSIDVGEILKPYLQLIDSQPNSLEQMLGVLFNGEMSFMMDTEEIFARVKTKLPNMGKGSWTDVAIFLFFCKQYKVAEKTFRRVLNIAIENDSDEDRRQCYDYLAKLAQMRGDTEEYKQLLKHKNMLNSKSTSHAQGLAFDEFAYLRNYNEDNTNSNQYADMLRKYSDLMRQDDSHSGFSSDLRGFGSAKPDDCHLS